MMDWKNRLFIEEMTKKVENQEEITREEYGRLFDLVRDYNSPEFRLLIGKVNSEYQRQQRLKQEPEPEPQVDWEDYRKARDEFKRNNTPENYARMKKLERLWEKQSGEQVAPPKISRWKVDSLKHLYEMQPTQENLLNWKQAEQQFRQYQNWMKRMDG